MLPVMQWDGKKISREGIYADVPMDFYHGDCCVGPSISSSGLRTIELKTPAHYWAHSPLNPNRVPEDSEKPAFRIGRAVHTLLAAPETFLDEFSIRPSQWQNYTTKAAKEWRDAEIAAGRSVLTLKEHELVAALCRAIENEPIVQQGVLDGLVEHSMFWKDPETSVWLKARPDVWTVAADSVVDLKAVHSADFRTVQNSIGSFGYHMQLALVGEGHAILTKREIPHDGYLLFCVEKTVPYLVNLKPVEPDSLDMGRRQIRRAVRTFAECLKSQDWPGYPDSGQAVGLAGWLKDRLERQIEAGDLPAPLKVSS